MGLRLAGDDLRRVDALDPELRAGAEAIGIALSGRLTGLRPGLVRPAAGETPEATLAALELDHEGAPDALSLVACLAAHRSYVGARGQPEGVSLGALALGRLLVWAQRAALLGVAPRVDWLGPAARAPETDSGQFALGARAALTIGDRTREARAVALVSRPP